MRQLLIAIIALTVVVGCNSTNTVRQSPAVPEVEQGDKAFAGGDYPQAIQYYNMWLTKYPEDAEVYLRRGRAHRQVGQNQEARKDFEKASSLRPDDLRAQVYLCLVFDNAGNFTEEGNALRSLMNHPAFGQLGAYEQFLAWTLDGALKNRFNQYQAALGSLDQAVAVANLHPDVMAAQGSAVGKRWALYHRVRARFYMSMHDEQMIRDMEEYITLTKQGGYELNAEDYKTLAIVLYLNRENDKCQKVLALLNEDDRKTLGKAVDDARFFAPGSIR
jgi:tetratricopeptide (TPR) repeat protein